MPAPARAKSGARRILRSSASCCPQNDSGKFRGNDIRGLTSGSYQPPRAPSPDVDYPAAVHSECPRPLGSRRTAALRAREGPASVREVRRRRGHRRREDLGCASCGVHAVLSGGRPVEMVPTRRKLLAEPPGSFCKVAPSADDLQDATLLGRRESVENMWRWPTHAKHLCFGPVLPRTLLQGAKL